MHRPPSDQIGANRSPFVGHSFGHFISPSALKRRRSACFSFSSPTFHLNPHTITPQPRFDGGHALHFFSAVTLARKRPWESRWQSWPLHLKLQKPLSKAHRSRGNHNLLVTLETALHEPAYSRLAAVNIPGLCMKILGI